MSDKEIFMRGTELAIEGISKELETITLNLGKLSYLEAAEMPEYKTAIESIRKYREAVVKKIGLLFDKDAQGLLD